MTSMLELHCLDLGNAVPLDDAVLSPEERQRAERLAFPYLRRRFVTAHSLMRQRLGRALGVAPETLDFRTGAHGKPVLPGFPRLAFNFSHSEDLALLALWMNEDSTQIQLGVDVEARRTSSEFYGISRRYFAPAEQACLPSPLHPEFSLAFLRLWTRKEAVTKCLGTGLRTPLTSFDTCSAPLKLPSVAFLPQADRAQADWQPCCPNPQPLHPNQARTCPACPSSPTPLPPWLYAGCQVQWLQSPVPTSTLAIYEIDFAAWGAPELADKYMAALCLTVAT